MNIPKLLTRLAIDHPKVGKAKIASAITHRGRIVSFGFNSLKSDPLQKRFCGTNPHRIYLHAEMAALKKASKRLHRDVLAECTIWTVRVKRDLSGKWVEGNASPCQGCQQALAHYGLGEIWFSK